MEEMTRWTDPMPLLDQLARLTLEHKHGEDVGTRAALDGLWLALIAPIGGDEVGLPGPEAVTRDDVRAALRLLPYDRAHLDRLEVLFIEAGLDRGDTLTSLAELYGMSRQALGKRYRALGGRRELAPGRPQAGALVFDPAALTEPPPTWTPSADQITKHGRINPDNASDDQGR